MDSITFSRIVTAVISLLGISYLYYLYIYRHKPDIILHRRTFISSLCLSVASISAVPRPIIPLFHIVGVICVHQGSLFAYFVVDQIFNKHLIINIWKTKIYIASTIVSMLAVSFDGIRFFQGNIASFMDNDPFVQNFPYFMSYFINYSLLCTLMMLISYMYYRNIVQYIQTELTYNLRRITSFLGFYIAAITMFTLVLNITVYYLGFTQYRVRLNVVYQNLRSTFVMLIVISPFLPQFLINLLVYPYTWYTRRRKVRRRTAMMNLHRYIAAITPNIILGVNEVLDDRCDIEILDGRDLILSHQAIQPQTPEQEAQLIMNLFLSGAHIFHAGPYTPSVPSHTIDAVAQTIPPYDSSHALVSAPSSASYAGDSRSLL